MGALVLTKGTRKLIDQFTQEFSHPRLDDYRSDNIMGTTIPIAQAFADPSIDLLWLTRNVRHRHSPRGDNRCLLPDDTTGHPHLEARWLYFLSNNPNVLTATNHQKIRKAISGALNDRSYDSIQFDCIDCSPQTVFVSDEFDSSGLKYLRIVLGTPPMSKSPSAADPGLDLDPQGGYTPFFAPDRDPGSSQGSP